MVPRSNIHTHTRFSDGVHTAEEMVLAAIDKGFVSLGFSEHAWTPYDSDCCIKKEDIPAYFAEIARLKAVYADRIEIYCGFELDCLWQTPWEGLDFTIASAHYLYSEETGEYYTFDYKPEQFEKGRDIVAGGEIRRMAAIYYDRLADYVERCRPDIVGHIDIIAKLNGRYNYFDEDSDWYRALTRRMADRIAAAGCIVEVNTGAIYRGYREVPYPAPDFLRLLYEREVPVLLSSDAHGVESLDFWFDEAAALLRETGYRSVKQLRGGRFVDVAL